MKALRTVLIACLLGALAGNAWCDPHKGSRYDDREHSDNHRRSVRDVIGDVERDYRGRVVDVQTLRPSGNEDMYRVRVLQDGGRVKTLRVPADRHNDRHRE